MHSVLDSCEMNSLHLAAGAVCPPLVPGSLRIYSMRYCPYAHRALLVAAAKGIKYDVVNINLLAKPEFIFQKNPEGRVPTIETNDGRCLYESLIVGDYIDDAFDKTSPSAGDTAVRRLTPQDPFQKALDRIWIEKIEKISGLEVKLYLNTALSSDQIQALIKQLIENLAVFEKELQRRGTKYFAGESKPGMMDYMIWPWMERLPSLELILPNETASLTAGHAALKTLVQWEKDMINDDAVKESYLSPLIHAEYRQMRRDGRDLDYDFMHKKN